MHCTNLRRCVVSTPLRLGKVVRLLLVVLQHVCDRAGDLLQLPLRIEQIHHVVLVSHFIRETARPCFDLVEFVVFLVVTRLADVDFLIRGKVAGTALVVPRHKHDKAAVNHLVNAVVTVLSSLDHLIL
jgi:hypothetical protein